MGKCEMRYFKVYTEDEVLLLQARAREDVHAWMLRDYQLSVSQYATSLIDLEELNSALEGGLDPIAVPVGLARKVSTADHFNWLWKTKRPSNTGFLLRLFAASTVFTRNL